MLYNLILFLPDYLKANRRGLSQPNSGFRVFANVHSSTRSVKLISKEMKKLTIHDDVCLNEKNVPTFT